MHVLYVIDSLAPGGAEASLVEMAPGLIAGGIDLHVLPLGRRLDLSGRLEAVGAVVHERTARDGRIGNVRAVMKVIRQTAPGLVHTTLYEADVAGRTAAQLLRTPSSTSIVNDSYGPSHYAESSNMKLTVAQTADAVTARFAEGFHSISTAVADRVAPRLRIDRDLVKVIPRGRDPEAFPLRTDETQRQARAELGVSAAGPIILAVGRLEPQKGLQHLLAALPNVHAAHPNALILVAGKDGRAGPALRSTAAALDADVRFLGHRTDVATLLTAADVFCFPSDREGFGGVLIEALAVGCPIVASSIPTSQEVLGVGGASTGILVPMGSPKQLEDALAIALANPSEAAVRARDGRARFDRLFTIHTVVPQMISFFQDAADPARGRSTSR